MLASELIILLTNLINDHMDVHVEMGEHIKPGDTIEFAAYDVDDTHGPAIILE